jgi:thiamine-monophosphate kinase
MRLNRIGELNLLAEIRKRFSSKDGDVLVGIGDDAAVIAPPGRNILVTTDMMNEGVHFDTAFISPFQLGVKLVSVNVSDISAMGGEPRYLFLDLSMKEDVEEADFQALCDGIYAAVKFYGISLLGGDLSSSVNDMVVSATVMGLADRPVTRGGARPGDMIYVTSTLGDSACGLQMLKRLSPESREGVKGIVFQDAPKDGLLELVGDRAIRIEWDIGLPLLLRHLMPVARDPSGIGAVATAMIDLSDGLFMDLGRLCDESRTGARVYEQRIPVSDAMRFVSEGLGLDPMRLAVSGGEDYELLFTAPPGAVISNTISGRLFPGLDRATQIGITCIGEITGQERMFVYKDGSEKEMKREGYRHFGAA